MSDNKPKIVQVDRMLVHFNYQHLPDELQQVSSQFAQLANYIVDNLKSGPERTVALRKLLEAKDAAVRAKVRPGG